MKPHFKGKLLVQTPCTLENSYTLGCMTIHPIVIYPSCIQKSIVLVVGETLPMSGLWQHSTSLQYYGFLRSMDCTLHVKSSGFTLGIPLYHTQGTVLVHLRKPQYNYYLFLQVQLYIIIIIPQVTIICLV